MTCCKLENGRRKVKSWRTETIVRHWVLHQPRPDTIDKASYPVRSPTALEDRSAPQGSCRQRTKKLHHMLKNRTQQESRPANRTPFAPLKSHKKVPLPLNRTSGRTF
ncbi:unnamed protein product [Nesidiocoris tenuis]|uniref:Uncharacterized protein n=1 Tax=Nesidiocoris tenuis TaxID=355587 RepID=A0A6H5H241_9HEMI|nr:unnamed protein product [Nesidiocoris tenuis]